MPQDGTEYDISLKCLKLSFNLPALNNQIKITTSCDGDVEIKISGITE